MADLFWPGDERAGHHFSSASFLRAMVSIEGEWLGRDLDVPDDLAGLTRDAGAGGNPVIPLVRMLRDQLDEDAERLHRGFTSQDVVDSALMRTAESVSDLRMDLEGVVEDLVRLAEEHRDTPMVARTLTQHAVPTTFGFRVAAWLTAVLDAYDDLARRTLVAVSQTADPVAGLQVHRDRMAATLAAAGDAVLAEQRSMAEVAGLPPAPSYLGDADRQVDRAVACARKLLERDR